MLRIVTKWNPNRRICVKWRLLPCQIRLKKARQDTVSVLKEFPFFPGDFNEFIFSNFHYPPSLQENCIQGRVVVKFCINPKGKCDHFSIVRSVDPLIDKEVLRVLKLMPKWKWRDRTKKCLWMVKAVEFQLR